MIFFLSKHPEAILSWGYFDQDPIKSLVGYLYLISECLLAKRNSDVSQISTDRKTYELKSSIAYKKNKLTMFWEWKSVGTLTEIFWMVWNVARLWN